MNKTIKEIEQDEKQLDKVRNQLYGHMDSIDVLPSLKEGDSSF